MDKSRRSFLSHGLSIGVGTVVADLIPAHTLNALGQAPMRALATPSPSQLAWQDLEIGMFVHIAPQTWQGTQSDNDSTPASEINPKDLNTDQWASAAVRLGAKYIVFVAKHEGGFCMWPTKTTDYSIRSSPWKNGHGDVVADIAASCKKYGLKLGIYVSPRDDHFGAATGGRCKTPELQARYNVYYREQLKEVLSGYGPMVEVWFDGSTATPVGDLLKTYQPDAVIFQGPNATIRWVGNENGFAPYPCWNGIDAAETRTGGATALDSDPNGTVWLPSEVDVSIRRPDWFWNPSNQKHLMTQDQLLSIYYRSVGRGAQLLLNIPANTDGLLPQPDSDVAASFGREIARRFAKPLASTSGSGETCTLHLGRSTRIDTVILEEDLRNGERVRAYRIEGNVGGTWRTMGTGSAIGHKRIQPIEPVSVEEVRLVATRYAATPQIRTLAVFDTGTAPPKDWDMPTEVWSSDLAGKWQDGHFSLDLTSKIKAAARYKLRFISQQGDITEIRNVVLELGGVVASPAFVAAVKGHPDEVLLDMTSVGVTVKITGDVKGASAGQITLQKL